MKKILGVLLFLFISSTAFSQTTVTLQDQCNCEVLSGTDVSTPGATTPTGADTGDIYVNTNTGTIFFWDGNSWELTSTDDQQLQNFSFNNTTNILSLEIEDGNIVTVDLSPLSTIGTDDQNLSTTGAAGNIGIEDGNSITLNVDDADADPTNELQDAAGVAFDDTTSGLGETDVQGAIDALAAGSTDDQNINGSGLSGTDLTIGIENGTNEVVDLSSLVGTDDQNLTLSGTDLSIEDGNTVDLSGFVSTDDQNISGSGLSGTDLTIGIENGTNEVVDLSSLVGTDDQNIESLGVDTGTNILTVGIENGTSQTVDLSHLDDAGTDDQNLTLSGTDLSIEDGNTVDLSGFVSTDDQNISGSGLSGTDLTIGIENGTNEVVDLSSLVGTDDQNLTLSGTDLSIEDGNTVDLSGFVSTDDQNISGSGLSGTDLTIGIENGTNEVVDLSSLVGTDDQTAAEVSVADAGGNFTSTDVEGALAELATGSTDDQNISGSGLSGTDLTIGIENGTNEVVDLSSLVGTDDQNLTLSGTDLSIEDGNNVDLSGFVSTDDQNISGSGLSGTDLTIGIENGTNEVVDLSSLVGTDDQNIESLGVDTGTNILTVGIENGTSQTVDLSHLDDAGTDNQNLTLSGTDLSIEDGNTVDLSGFVSTDDQNISGSGLSGTDLTIGIENGTNEVVDLSSLVGTDDQNIESLGVDTGTNILTVGIEDGTSQTVDLSHLDDAGTDDQNISGSGLSGTDLTIGIENGTNEVVDLSSLVGTDDQNIESLGVDTGTNILTVGIENGTSQTVDLSHLDDAGTDDQTAAEVSVADAGGNFTSTDVEGALAELAAGSTDDQNISGSGLSGTDLTIGIENGTNEVVDLSSLVGTDDQTAAEVSVADAGGNFTSTDVEGALAELATGSTDDQNISGSGLSGTDLTIGIENGTNEVVDLSSLVGTDDQNLTLSGTDLSIEDGNTVDLSGFVSTDDQNISGSGLSGTDLTIGIENGTNEVVDLSSLVGTDDQNIESLGVDTGTNILTVGIEDGTSQTVDLSHLDDAGTDDQNLTLSGTDLSIEDGNTVDLSGFVSTDDQNISGSGLSGTDLTIGIENGANEVVDLSSLVGTDDQTAAEVSVADVGGNFTSTDVEGALAELAAGSTDDQNISGSGLSGTDLTIGIENGTNEVVDLSSLVGTDDQTLSTNGTAGNISIEDGNTLALNVDDADADPSNEYNTGSVMNAGSLEITDGGGTESVNLISADANNDLAAGTDGALYLNVASVSIAETNTTLSFDTGTNQLTYTNELGNNPAVDLSSLDDSGTDDQNLTLSGTDLSIEDGNTVDLSGFVSTDDQNISGSGLSGTDLTIGIENGTNEVVDLSSLVGTDDQNLTLSGTDLSIEDGNTVDLSGFVSTDDQNISGSGLSGTDLTIGIENGTNEVVDLSSLVGTDDQNLTLSGTDLSIEDGNTVDLSGFVSTDDQNISGSGLSGTDLTIGIENGTNEVVDLSSLVGTDDQNIESLGVDTGTNILTVGIENGASQTVDLSHLDDAGTDDQTAAEVSVADAGGNFTSTDVEGALAELAAGSTDDQNIESLGVDTGTNILTVGIENGASQTVDLSHLDDAGTDDQTAAEVSVADAGGNFTSTDVEGALAELAAGSTDDQNISGSGLSGTDLTIGIENGTNEVVDLSSLVGTDDQNIESLGVDTGTNILTVGIENGTSQTVDLSHLDDAGTDDQNLTLSGTDLSIEDGNTVDLSGFVSTDDQNISGSGLSGTDLTIGIENGTNEVVDLSSLVGTDDQNISGSGLSGTDLTIGIENGTNEVVDLSSLVGTDDQNIESLGVDTGTNILTVGIENGTSQTVDLSHLDDAGTDDQTAAEVSVADAGGNFTSTDVEGALAELAAGSTDDQNISGSGLSGTDLTIGIENGTNEVVDLSSLVGTDDQNIESLGVDTGTNILTVGIEDGTSQTVDLSHLDDAGTDDQNISGSGLSGTDLTIGIENGTNEVVDLSSLVGTDDQNIESLGVDTGTNILTVGIENGTSQTVDLSHLDDAGTDDQNISGSGLSGTDLTIGIENGTNEVVDLSSLVGTDDQNIESLGVDTGTNILTVGIENGTSQTVDLSHLDDAGTDDQTAAEVSVADAGGNFTSTDVEGALAELAAGSTDDQNISGSGLSGTDLTIGIENGTNEVVDLSSLVGTDDQNIESLGVDTGTNILTVGIENGTSQTVDLSHLDDAGTDDQTAAEVSVADAGGNFTSTDVEGALAELAAGSTDDQNISGSGLSGTDLTIGIENGTNEVVDLSSLVGTDDQNLTLSGTDLSIEDGNTVDLSGFVSTDDQNISGSGLSGTDLTIGIENGTNEVVDLSSLVGTDDQTAAEVSVADAGGNFTSTDVEGALAELAAGSTDDQNISGSGLSGTDLTIGIENGTNEVVDLSSLVGTDDQNIESLGVDTGTNILTVGIENGTSQTVDLSHLDDAGTDDQTAAEVSVADAGGNFTSTDVEGALAELATGSTDDQNISGSGLSGTDLTIGIENGTNEVVDLSSLVGTDDQNIESLGVDTGTNILTVGIENGTSQTVDLSHLDDAGTDDQNISGSGLSGTDLTIGIENGTNEVVDLSSLVGTDDQNIESLGVDTGTNILTVGIENGTSQTVDLSHLDDAGTDDQNLTLSGTDLSIEDGNTVDLSGFVSTDDQNISGSGLSGTDLTIGIENGTNEVVDLSSLVGTDDQNLTLSGTDLSIEDGNTVDLSGFVSTDDQNISGSGLSGTDLTIGIENGTNEVVDLSSLVGTDDQTAAEVSVADAGGNFTSTDVEGALAELAAGSTDDQNISGSGLSGTDLTIGIENGTNEVVDLSSLVGTDDQNIESLGVDTGTNILTVGIEDGTSQTVDLSHLDDAGTDDQTAAEVSVADAGGNFTSTDVEGALAELAAGSTDDQNISGSGLSGTDLTIGIENGANEVVDLSSLVGTDDQNISGSGLSGTDLTIGIENGTNEVVDLSSLVGTDDQNIESLGVDTGTNILTVGIENGTSQTVDLSHLDDAGTDDQTAAEVSIADAGGNFTSTDVEGALAELAAGSTDDQNISGSGLSGTDLTIGIENGTNEVVDLSSLVGTDDQTAAEVSVADAGGNFTSTDVEGALAELAAGSTDDQNISGSGLLGTDLTIGIENGTNEVVDLSSLVGTDDQNIESLGVDTGTNILTVGIENGTSQTVDLSHLDDAGTDDQNLTLSGTDLSIEDGNTVDLSGFVSTDDQNISGSGLSGTDLTIGIENGTNEVVDLSSLVGTDDQNIESLGVDTGTNILTVGIENGTSQTVDLSHLDDAGTDDQNISGSGLSGTDLTIGIENGTNEVVDLSSLVGTDDQNIESLGVDTGTNILTVGIENGTSQTVDLSHLDDAGTDDQNISGSGLSGTDLTIGIENGTNEVVDLSSLADDDDVSVTNTVAGNRIATISEPGTAAVDINETVTSLSQNTSTGVISYTDEDGGAAETANVVSTDANNQISVGSDGGAFMNMPRIYAAGKVSGNGTAASIYGATVSRSSEGDYDVTFSTALSNANYIIQLTTLDCGGDCPGNTGQNFDDPGISYYGQATTGFSINIGDSDNGSTQKDDIDLEFMFTVIVLPN